MTNLYRCAVITGASSGIGREFCLQLAAGAKVFAIGRNTEELAITRQLCANKDITVVPVQADLTKREDLARVVDAVKDEPIDLLVLNAGGGSFGSFLDNDLGDECRTIDINVTANVILTKTLIPRLLFTADSMQRRAGLIIVSSHAAYLRVPRFAVYAACKAFLLSFGQTLAVELQDRPLDLLILCPGATKTKFSTRSNLPPKMISTPADPAFVAELGYSALGKRRMQLTSRFDLLLFLANRVIPTEIFDNAVARIQNLILKRKGRINA